MAAKKPPKPSADLRTPRERMREAAKTPDELREWLRREHEEDLFPGSEAARRDIERARRQQQPEQPRPASPPMPSSPPTLSPEPSPPSPAPTPKRNRGGGAKRSLSSDEINQGRLYCHSKLDADPTWADRLGLEGAALDVITEVLTRLDQKSWQTVKRHIVVPVLKERG
jgi:hypothetical protein